MIEALIKHLRSKVFLKGWNGTITLHVADGVPRRMKVEESIQISDLA